MKAKEKATDLVIEFAQIQRDFNQQNYYGQAKKSALLCVDEMIKQNGDLYLKGINESYYKKTNSYLFEVKQEINNL
jgi:hypothetical protein